MSASSPLAEFIGGALSAGYIIAAVFFWRFWRRNGDRLFIAFAAAFCLLALNCAIPAVRGVPREEQTEIYLIRLAAFVLIILAIVLKNLPSRRGGLNRSRRR